MKHQIQKQLQYTTFTLLAVSIALTATVNIAQAESLFQAGVSYQSSQPFLPRSLFATPRSTHIGDMITININETTQTTVQNNNTISNKRTLSENSSNILNSIIKRVVGVGSLLPSVDGLNNDNETSVTAKAQKTYSFTDSITCQVVQVLPNGEVVVQGRKTIFANNEEQELLVSGIINPYYLDANNTIASSQVGNLQMHIAGKGTISRQQGDGIIGKYYKIIN